MKTSEKTTTEKTQKTLFFNTYDLDNRCGNDGETYKKYRAYCEKFAQKNEMLLVEYSSLNGYYENELNENEFVDSENNSSFGLNLWDDFCSGRKIKKAIL